MSISGGICPGKVVQSFCRGNMVLNVVSAHKRYCFEYVQADACYDFFVPLGGFVFLHAGHTKQKIGEGEMLCVNPWQLRKVSPVGDEINYAQLTYKEAYIRHLFSELYEIEFDGFQNCPVSVEHDLFDAINNLMCENYLDSPGKRIMIDSIGYELSISLLRYVVQAGAVKVRKKAFCTDTIAKVTEYIYEKHDQHITDVDMSEYAKLSKYHMIRQFKQVVGITPRAYLIQVRIGNAKKMLAETNMSMKRIAELCGYITSSHFTESFKKITGYSPSEFRQQKKET